MYIAVQIAMTLVMAGTFVWLLLLFIATLTGSPIVYANREAVLASLKLANLKKGDLLVDLGCGDARSLITAAKLYGAKGIGVDRSPLAYFKSRFNVFMAGERGNIKIIRGDFKRAEKILSDADAIYLYLLNSTLAQIEGWLFASVGDKTKVVSLAFEFPNVMPAQEIDTFALGRKTKARLYRKS